MAYLDGLLSGMVVGGAYALLAVGVTLIFSTTGVLNFAHAGFAMAAAYSYSWLAGDQGVSVWVAALVAVAITAILGAVVERLVIRRVDRASQLTRLMATLGVLALLQGLVLQIFGFGPRTAPALLPEGSFSIGEIAVTYQQTAVLVTALVLVLALGAFLRFTRLGLAIRAVAQDQDAARLMGIGRSKVARFNWTIAAFLAGIAGVLIAPLSIITVATFPLLLLKALAATLLGGATSLFGSVLGGFAVGSADGVATTASSVPGVRELFLFFIVIGVLVVRRRWPAGLSAVDVARPGRVGSPVAPAARLALAGMAVAVVVAALRSEFWAFVGVLALVYALAAISLVIVTGWTGQVSLMHGSLLGLGAFAMAWCLNDLGLAFPAAVVVVTAAGGAFGALASIPSLRLRGLQLGIATLVVSAAMSEWLFQTPAASRLVPRPEFLLQDRRIFLVLLSITGVVFLLARNLRFGSWGRMFFAVRQSEDAAAQFGVRVARVRMSASVVSGMIAALAGAFYAVLLTSIKPADFGPILSISLLLYAAVGGIESLAGPVIAALVFAVGPQLVKVSQTTASALPDIVSGLLVLLLIVARPQGLASFLQRARTPRTEARPAPTETHARATTVVSGRTRLLARTPEELASRS